MVRERKKKRRKGRDGKDREVSRTRGREWKGKTKGKRGERRGKEEGCIRKVSSPYS